METPTPRVRVDVGAAVRHERKSRGLSIEAAARAGSVGHMTWRKIESGGSVHDQSLYAVDRSFGWQSGHTLDVIQSDGEKSLHPAPSADEPSPSAGAQRPRTATRDEILSMPNESDPQSGSFNTVLTTVENLTVPELRALNTVVETIISERTEKLAKIREVIDNVNMSVPEFNRRYAFQTSEEIAQEYHDSYGAYMHTWAEMQGIREHAHKLESQIAPSVQDLRELWQRAHSASEKLESVVDRFNDVEARAVHDLHETAPPNPSAASRNETE